MARAICQLSGGWDSTAALILTLESQRFKSITPLLFNSGQPYAWQERYASKYVVRRLSEKYPELEALVEVNVTLQQQQLEQLPEYVPLRNLVYAAMSANYARADGAEVIVVGNKTDEMREGDLFCFRDCSREFFARTEAVVNFASEPGSRLIRFEMPLVYKKMSKVDILNLIRESDLLIAQLWSCYRSDGVTVPCGVCYHCQENDRALAESKLVRPEK